MQQDNVRFVKSQRELISSFARAVMVWMLIVAAAVAFEYSEPLWGGIYLGMALVVLLVTAYTAHTHAQYAANAHEIELAGFARGEQFHLQLLMQNRQVIEGAQRSLAESGRMIEMLRAALSAKAQAARPAMNTDAAEVLDAAHCLALDWRDQAGRRSSEELGTGILLTPDDLTELISFLEIAIELVAPGEQLGQVTTDEGVTEQSPPSFAEMVCLPDRLKPFKIDDVDSDPAHYKPSGDPTAA
ncbi:MAG: hypothetical protein V4641_05720 [Pseudomonadota bacterium]